MQVTVPAGVSPGEMVQNQTPSGQMVQAQVQIELDPQEPALARVPSAPPAQQLMPTDAAQPQRTRQLVEEELASLTKRQLRERAASVGVSRAEIQRAADGATPKRDVSASAHALPSALMVYPCLYRWSG